MTPSLLTISTTARKVLIPGRRRALQIDAARLSIPPAYTQFIGEQLLDQITRQDVA